MEGTIPRFPVVQNTVRQFSLIDRLIPPLLDGDQSFPLFSCGSMAWISKGIDPATVSYTHLRAHET